MFVILCYDVGVKRYAKVNKTVRAFLRPVQSSVCEGYITESKLKKLCARLRFQIVPEEDAIVIYTFSAGPGVEKIGIGQALKNEDFIL